LKKKAQNLVEFVVVFPLIIILIFGIIEIALFWKAVHTVQEIALKAAANAATQIVLDYQTSMDSDDLDCSDGECFNFAAAYAMNIAKDRQGSPSASGIYFTTSFLPHFGTPPYTAYDFVSDNTVSLDGVSEPLMKLSVDYSDPYKKGVIVQLLYWYSPVFYGAEFSLPGGQKITIIPKHIQISSTKIQQYIHN